jgi:hypothetical protein
MIDLTGVEHHPAITEIVDVLCAKTQNTDRGFFQTEAAFFLGKIAACMRASIVTKDRGEIPVNVYALALATSGYGKGHSIYIVEDDFMKPFKRRFMENTLHVISEKHLWDIASDRALKNGTDQQTEFDAAQKEFRLLGAYPFTFDSGTGPAVKQLRQKLLMAGIGGINLQIDEIGSNLISNTEVLTLFLELFDQGIVKQKLVKNTADNTRNEELDGKTPTNMLLFGTPSKLFDGGQTENEFYSFLETGYARRCIFGYGHQEKKPVDVDPAELYAKLTQAATSGAANKWSMHFHKLADPAMYEWKMLVPDDVAIQLLRYKLACEAAAEKLPEHEEIRKAEMSHRYFKALKLAGAYAFVDASSEVEMEHLMSAILLVEESGAAFQHILTREKPYVKLAKYIADMDVEVTHADLMEALPFYGKSQSQRNELMTLATAWGYKKHIIIKKSFRDNIEFFEGDKLKETDLSEMIVSYGEHWAYDYLAERAPFDQLHMMTQAEGVHWANHHFKNGHRAEENVLPGFNMVSIDVDGGVSVDTVHELLKDTKHLIYTTKRHQAPLPDGTGFYGDRFRLILPINYELHLDTEEYREFMNSLMEWLPFKTDESANQRAKKWESYNGFHYYNLEGELLDALNFIPRTSRGEAYRAQTRELQSLDNLERWFAQRMESGNRNNQMIKFALALVDSGMDLHTVGKQVHGFNSKLGALALSTDEIDSTVMVTVAKRFHTA